MNYVKLDFKDDDKESIHETNNILFFDSVATKSDIIRESTENIMKIMDEETKLMQRKDRRNKFHVQQSRMISITERGYYANNARKT